jgi:integrase/recombinase XerD
VQGAAQAAAEVTVKNDGTDLSPHDLRRTAITRALESGLTYRQVQMMSGHKDPKTVMRYDHGRENMEQNAVNFLDYGED